MLAALVLALALVAAACAADDTEQGAGDGGDGGGADAPVAEGTFVRGEVFGPPDGTDPQPGGKIAIGMEAETESVDPTRVPLAVSGHMVASAIYDPLLTADENGEPAPWIFTGWEHSDDYLTWTFDVAEGVTFHDGLELTPQIVLDDLLAYQASPISGLGFQFVDTVELNEAGQIVITQNRPATTTPFIFLSQVAYVIHPELLADGLKGEEPIGTGPFMFSNREKNVSWQVVKNPDYWRDGLPYLDEIDFFPIPDDAERVALLESGDLDLIHTNKPEQVLQLRDSDFKRMEYDNGEKDFIVLNTSEPPFDNLAARQAVAYATDYEGWLMDVNQGVKPKATGFLSPGQLGFEEDTGFPTHDLEKAKAAVAQYEEETGQPLSFTYIARDDVTNLRDAQFLASSWEEAGMEVTVEGQPQSQLIAKVATGGYTLGEWRLFGDPQPDAYVTWLRSSSVVPFPGVSLNFARIQDADLDAALDRAAEATDDQTKADAFRTANEQLAEALPYIWLGRPMWVLAAAPSVNGIGLAANGSVQTLGPKTWLAELWVST